MVEYRGNWFEMKEVNDWRSKNTEYKITGIEAETPELWLPGTYQGNAVVSWDMEMKTDCYMGGYTTIVGNTWEGDSAAVIESAPKKKQRKTKEQTKKERRRT